MTATLQDFVSTIHLLHDTYILLTTLSLLTYLLSVGAQASPSYTMDIDGHHLSGYNVFLRTKERLEELVQMHSVSKLQSTVPVQI